MHRLLFSLFLATLTTTAVATQKNYFIIKQGDTVKLPQMRYSDYTYDTDSKTLRARRLCTSTDIQETKQALTHVSSKNMNLEAILDKQLQSQFHILPITHPRLTNKRWKPRVLVYTKSTTTPVLPAIDTQNSTNTTTATHLLHIKLTKGDDGFGPITLHFERKKKKLIK